MRRGLAETERRRQKLQWLVHCAVYWQCDLLYTVYTKLSYIGVKKGYIGGYMPNIGRIAGCELKAGHDRCLVSGHWPKTKHG